MIIKRNLELKPNWYAGRNCYNILKCLLTYVSGKQNKKRDPKVSANIGTSFTKYHVTNGLFEESI